jgi:hypothetical protein
MPGNWSLARSAWGLLLGVSAKRLSRQARQDRQGCHSDRSGGISQLLGTGHSRGAWDLVLGVWGPALRRSSRLNRHSPIVNRKSDNRQVRQDRQGSTPPICNLKSAIYNASAWPNPVTGPGLSPDFLSVWADRHLMERSMIWFFGWLKVTTNRSKNPTRPSSPATERGRLANATSAAYRTRLPAF